MLQDLPDLKQRAGLAFSVSLAKGRGRYMCLKRLDDHPKYQDQQEIPIFDVSTKILGVVSRDAQPILPGQLGWRAGQRWSRCLTVPGLGSLRIIAVAVTTAVLFSSNAFFRARNNLEGDVIVANHDLVLADLLWRRCGIACARRLYLRV